MADQTQTFVTDSHHLVLNAGGLLLLELEEIEDADEELTPDVIARHAQSRLLSPGEALKLAAFVEQNRAYLEARQRDLDHRFTQVAAAWLDEFREPAALLMARGRYWWPEVFHVAHGVLVRLMHEGSIQVITTWYEQALHDENFPLDQQQTLLFRYFKKLYFERYSIPEGGEDEGREGGEGEIPTV